MALRIRTTGFEDFLDGSANIKMMIVGGPDVGKGFPLDTPVLTPTGWTEIGNLVVGDQVIGSRGHATTVTEIYDRGEQPLYRLTFSDGATVVCDGDHLWPFYSRKRWETRREMPTVHRTADLMGQPLRAQRESRKPRPRYYLPLVEPVQHDKVDLPVEPYLLGVLLANGSLSSDLVSFTTNDEHIAARVIEHNPHLSIAEHTYPCSTARRWVIHKFHRTLADLGLDRHKSRDKFVPEQYLVAHEDARHELLAGLMDCDGGVVSGGTPAYFTRSPQLAQDVQTLIRSLGGVARLQYPRDDGTDYMVVARVNDQPFTLPRKAEPVRFRRPFRYLMDIQPAGVDVTRCIKVDAGDELFVVVNHLVSHNTRQASYWPRPFYLDCENSRGSLADRRMPYAEIRNSADMLDALQYLKDNERIPKADRQFQTVVVDTLDSFQRKVKDEWLADNNAGVFRGFDAWGYLDAKLQLLLTRLLNLDYHVIVNVHWRDKHVEDDEPRTYELQLEGKVKDQVFNDFGLVGWMGTYWEHDPATGEKAERRGITFRKTTDRPFLKDRFHLFTDRWLPITFTDNDYAQISQAFAAAADTVPMPAAEDVGEIPPASATYTRDVVAPLAGGPVPPRPAKPRALADLTKPELMEKAKELGVAAKANWVKAELVAAIEKAHAAAPPATQGAQETGSQERLTQPAGEGGALGLPPATPDSPPTSTQDHPEGKRTDPAPDLDATGPDQPAQAANGVSPQADDTPSNALHLVKAELGATVIGEEAPPTAPVQPAPAQPPTQVGGREVTDCDQCGGSLAAENFAYIQLAWFRHRKHLCSVCYQAANDAAKATR